MGEIVHVDFVNRWREPTHEDEEAFRALLCKEGFQDTTFELDEAGITNIVSTLAAINDKRTEDSCD